MQDNTQNRLPLSDEDRGRFSRHILLPEVGIVGQERLKAARVLVIGVGGLGSPVSLYLAAAGVGTIGLVEFDRVDRSNLQRQILYSDADVGRPKIEAAAARLKALAPQITVETFAEALTAENVMRIVAGFDVVIDGTDNFATRYLVSDACVLLGKPNVYGSIFRFDGQTSVFDARQGPCYRCLFPEPPPADQVPNCAEGGVLGVLPGLIGTIQATEALKLILGIGSSLIGRLLIVDALTMRFEEFRMNKDKNCRACSDQATLKTPHDLAASCEKPLSVSQEIPQLPVLDYAKWRQTSHNHVLLDVRAPGELEVCRIEGSLNIPLPDLEARFRELDPSTTIVVQCRSGARSQRGAEFLYSQGFKDIYNLAGGILAWIDQVDPRLTRY